jgi:hypothetical protein
MISVVQSLGHKGNPYTKMREGGMTQLGKKRFAMMQASLGWACWAAIFVASGFLRGGRIRRMWRFFC